MYELYLDDLSRRGSVSPATVYQRRRTLTRLAAALPGGLPAYATAQDLAEWRNGLEGLAPVSVASYLAHANRFYEWAVARGLRADNPLAGLPRPRRPRMLPRPIGASRLFHAVGSAPARVRPWLVLAAWCGLRAREIAYLRRECVLEHARPPALLVSRQMAKGGRERIVPLCRYALAELEAAGLPGRGWVFRRADGGRGPNQPWRVSLLANQHLHECGYPETLHQLRHWFGTQAYRESLDLRLVQELMGHARPETTAGYSMYAQDRAASVLESLPVPVSSRFT